MGLIVGQADVKASFVKQWKMKYVPAIIVYASVSTKKNICGLLTDTQGWLLGFEYKTDG